MTTPKPSQKVILNLVVEGNHIGFKRVSASEWNEFLRTQVDLWTSNPLKVETVAGTGRSLSSPLNAVGASRQKANPAAI